MAPKVSCSCCRAGFGCLKNRHRNLWAWHCCSLPHDRQVPAGRKIRCSWRTGCFRQSAESTSSWISYLNQGANPALHALLKCFVEPMTAAFKLSEKRLVRRYSRPSLSKIKEHCWVGLHSCGVESVWTAGCARRTSNHLRSPLTLVAHTRRANRLICVYTPLQAKPTPTPSLSVAKKAATSSLHSKTSTTTSSSTPKAKTAASAAKSGSSKALKTTGTSKDAPPVVYECGETGGPAVDAPVPELTEQRALIAA
jgi:hypothetical protein